MHSEEHMGQVAVDQNWEACGTGACRGLSARAQQMTGSLCRAKDGCGVLGQSKWQGDEVKGWNKRSQVRESAGHVEVQLRHCAYVLSVIKRVRHCRIFRVSHFSTSVTQQSPRFQESWMMWWKKHFFACGCSAQQKYLRGRFLSLFHLVLC